MSTPNGLIEQVAQRIKHLEQLKIAALKEKNFSVASLCTAELPGLKLRLSDLENQASEKVRLAGIKSSAEA